MNGYRRRGIYICVYKMVDFETIWTYVNSLGDQNLGGWGKEWAKTEKGRGNPEMWLPRHRRNSANLTLLLTAVPGWREMLQGLEERKPGLTIPRAEFWSRSCRPRYASGRLQCSSPHVKPFISFLFIVHHIFHFLIQITFYSSYILGGSEVGWPQAGLLQIVYYCL